MIDILFTNRDEANAILNFRSEISGPDIDELAILLRKLGSKGVVLTDGANGHVINIEEEVLQHRHFPLMLLTYLVQEMP